MQDQLLEIVRLLAEHQSQSTLFPSRARHFLGTLLLDSDDAYVKAKEILAKRFGDPFAVADAYRKKMESWSRISDCDDHGLRKFSL